MPGMVENLYGSCILGWAGLLKRERDKSENGRSFNLIALGRLTSNLQRCNICIKH
jgi:hypothetical protein